MCRTRLSSEKKASRKRRFHYRTTLTLAFTPTVEFANSKFSLMSSASFVASSNPHDSMTRWRKLMAFSAKQSCQGDTILFTTSESVLDAIAANDVCLLPPPATPQAQRTAGDSTFHHYHLREQRIVLSTRGAIGNKLLIQNIPLFSVHLRFSCRRKQFA